MIKCSEKKAKQREAELMAKLAEAVSCMTSVVLCDVGSAVWRHGAKTTHDQPIETFIMGDTTFSPSFGLSQL